jgi:WhiB family redox-sensing transcriptional regulator
VVRECLDHALEVREPYGVWGGTTPEERAVMIASQAS